MMNQPPQYNRRQRPPDDQQPPSVHEQANQVVRETEGTSAPLQRVPDNLMQFPVRPALPVTLKWFLAVAAALACTAVLAFLLAEIDEQDQPRRRRSPRREGRQRERDRGHYYDDDDEDEDEDDDEEPPAARRRHSSRPARESRPSHAAMSSMPPINFNLPGGSSLQLPTTPSSAGGQS